MANEEHLAQIKADTISWNTFRERKTRPDLRGADLSFANLGAADLDNTDLDGADLSFATLANARLSNTSLRNADLSGANLQIASLMNADLRGADLQYTNLSGAYLGGVDLSYAKVFHTIFAETNLREAKGLAIIDHRGPSHIALQTVLLPQDSSAIHFLRGAGVPNEWIDIYRAQMIQPIHYHSLFISFSSKDGILARRLHADLQDHGVRCWFAPEDMKIGDEIRSRIDEAIHLQEKLLLLLSEYSLASTWVKNEVEAAFEKEEKQQRLMLFPIRLDESVKQTKTSWAATLRRTRHIGNFTRWTDPLAYQIAFERLLGDLKKADEQQDQEAKQ